MATEDLCLVCTDSLDFTGVGPCGHKEACSRCVARLRFVMEDTRCMLCKQDNPAVYFTRYMGDYTLAPENFSKLQERSQAGELYALPEVNGYFDDQDHYKVIKGLCSFTHPMAHGATFNTLNALKRRLLDTHKLHFCDLCIKGRKVFISEQVLYSKADLERHMRTGDDAGPLAESGFKGHPLCRFCKRRFYDGDELYRHMESAHEHCFICRKQQPHKFVYYKDYAELDGHFQSDHHPCPHPACLERKFVVFAEESDLKRHFATEHGNDANMSRAQRRQALSLNIQLTYNRREQDEAAAATDHLSRPGIVIGGGHNLQRSRGGRSGSSGMRHSHSESAMATALQASMDSSRAEDAARVAAGSAAAAAAAEGPSSVTFSAEDFPTVSGQGSSGATPLGTWLGAGPGAGSGPSLTQEDFPALPTMSRNQRRRQRERERNMQATLAARLGAANAPIRVVNRASPAPTPAEAAAAAAAAGISGGASRGGVRHSLSAGNLLGPSAGSSGAVTEEDVDGIEGFDSDTVPAAAEPPPPRQQQQQQQDHFPALAGASGAAAAATQAHPAWVPVRRSGKPPRPNQAGASSSAGSSNAAAVAPSSIADFPSLAATLPASKAAVSSSSGRSKAAAGVSSSRAGGGSSSSSSAQPPAQTVAEAVAASGGVSAELKAANKALIEHCKAALSEQGFRDFKEQSAGFMQGAISPDAYHAQVVQLGLLQLVPQLSALCPDADKRSALISAHRQYLESSPQLHQVPAGKGLKGWVPPEAAMAALAEAEQKGSWSCERCTLINAPSSRSCEVCSVPRPKPGQQGPSAAAVAAAAAGASSSSSSKQKAAAGVSSSSKPAAAPSWSAAAGGGSGKQQRAAGSSAQAAATPSASAAAGASSSSHAAQQPGPQAASQPALAESFPALPGASSSRPGSNRQAGAEAQLRQDDSSSQASSSSGAQSGKKKKGTKTPLSELLSSGKSHPQNSWTQQQRLSAVVAAPTGNRASLGSWGKQGGKKLAKSISAFNDAWGEK